MGKSQCPRQDLEFAGIVLEYGGCDCAEVSMKKVDGGNNTRKPENDVFSVLVLLIAKGLIHGVR